VAAVPCIGDGTSGKRVQMVYARSALAPDRYDELLPDFRAWAAEVDQAVWLSAGETGGGRHLRFVTQGCQLQVAEAVLTPLGEASFDQMRTELQLLGFNRADRKYMVWAGRGRGDLRTRRGLRRPAGHHWQLEQRRAHVRARGRPAGTTRSCTRSSTPWARSSPTAPTTARRATAPTRPTSCATTTTPAARSP
jgi:hypothetical protein